MSQIGHIDVFFCSVQHGGGHRQDEVVHVGVDGKIAGTAGAGLPRGQLANERALIAQLRGGAQRREQGSNTRTIVWAAQRHHAVHFTVQPQIFHGVTGQRAAHGMANQMGFFCAGGIENTLNVVDHLLREFTGIDMRRGVTH